MGGPGGTARSNPEYMPDSSIPNNSHDTTVPANWYNPTVVDSNEPLPPPTYEEAVSVDNELPNYSATINSEQNNPFRFPDGQRDRID